MGIADAEIFGMANFDKIKNKFATFGIDAKDVVRSNAYLVQSYARSRCPVDQGTLKRSIMTKQDTTNKDEIAWFIGSNLDYAAAQEYDETYHHRIGEFGFLRKGLNDDRPKFTTDVNELIKKYCR